MQLTFDELTKKVKEYIRILKLAKRPKREEFFKISKIAGAAMALIGTIGFSIYLLMAVLPKGF
jgi:protein transport protein SEC61 subunit gamma-like protein